MRDVVPRARPKKRPTRCAARVVAALALVLLLPTPAHPESTSERRTGESSDDSAADGDRPPPAGRLLGRADEIVSSVAEIRGLGPKKPIEKGVKTRDELREILVEKLRQEKSDRQLRREAAVYAKLGLIPPDLDYRETLLEVLTEQIAGFYDERRDRLNIMAGMPLSMQRPALAHEIFHALQDQHFDLLGLMKPFDTTRNGDFALARSALVEGDATVLMIDYYLYRDGTLPREGVDSVVDIPAMAQMLRQMDYENMSALQQLSPSDAGDTRGPNPSRLAGSSLSKAPAIIRRGLIFPYFGGMEFVIAMRRGRSWSEFDRIYDRAPVSTEQILHPERYAEGDEPVHLEYSAEATLPDDRYTRIYDNVLGEFQTRLYLDHHLGRHASEPGSTPASSIDVERAAAGWDGDRLRAFRSEDGRVVVTHLSVWDTTRDAEQFYTALVAAAERRFPGADVQTQSGEHGVSSCLFVESADSDAQPARQRVYIERWGDAVLQIEGTPARRNAAGAETDATTYRLRDEIWETHRRTPFREVLDRRTSSSSSTDAR